MWLKILKGNSNLCVGLPSRRTPMRSTRIAVLTVFILNFILAACGGTKAGSGSAESQTPAATPAPTSRLIKAAEVVSSAKKHVRSTQGYSADLTVGPTLGQIQTKSTNGYKVYLSVTGAMSSDSKK